MISNGQPAAINKGIYREVDNDSEDNDGDGMCSVYLASCPSEPSSRVLVR